MTSKAVVVYGLFIIMIKMVFANKTTVDDYLNICLDARHHKAAPGPESEQMLQCSPWKSRSCCTSAVADQLHISKKWLNFNWDHCKPLSPRCREHFIQDTCFHECSPNVGPWIVEDVRKIRKERFTNVPLCQSDCNGWWDACKDDLTCVERWDKHFNWSTGINTCPTGSTCKPFHEIYTDGNHFCESVFGSFKVANTSENCIHLWFDADKPNPNEEVARKKAAELLGVPYKVKGDKSDPGAGVSLQFHSSLTALLSCVSIAYILGRKL